MCRKVRSGRPQLSEVLIKIMCIMCKQKSLFSVHLTLKVTPHPGERVRPSKLLSSLRFLCLRCEAKVSSLNRKISFIKVITKQSEKKVSREAWKLVYCLHHPQLFFTSTLVFIRGLDSCTICGARCLSSGGYQSPAKPLKCNGCGNKTKVAIQICGIKF